MKNFMSKLGSWMIVLMVTLLPVNAGFVAFTTPVSAEGWDVLGWWRGTDTVTTPVVEQVPAPKPVAVVTPVPEVKPAAVVPPMPVIYAIDGDTVRQENVVYRLKGFDAPETKLAKCDAEQRLGKVAERRLAELIADGAELTAVGGTDKYKRTLATLTVTVDGLDADAGDVLIAEGLAVAYDGKSKRRSWCASK